GAELVVHAYPSGAATGEERLIALGLSYKTMRVFGTSEDMAFLLAHGRSANLIVAVGSHGNLREFLDKGRMGMASTFLVRLRVGDLLVDAKGVSRMYRGTVRGREAALLIGAALIAIAVVIAISPPLRLLFGDEVQTMLVTGQLSGKQVVMVTVDGVDPAEVDGVRHALEQGGATVVSLIRVTSRMALADDSSRRDLATIMGESPTTPVNLLSTKTAQSLGARLTNAPRPGDADLLQQLVTGRFLALNGGSAPLTTIGAGGQSVVFLAGGAQVPPFDLKGFLLPVVSAIVGANRAVVAAETTSSSYP